MRTQRQGVVCRADPSPLALSTAPRRPLPRHDARRRRPMCPVATRLPLSARGLWRRSSDVYRPPLAGRGPAVPPVNYGGKPAARPTTTHRQKYRCRCVTPRRSKAAGKTHANSCEGDGGVRTIRDVCGVLRGFFIWCPPSCSRPVVEMIEARRAMATAVRPMMVGPMTAWMMTAMTVDRVMGWMMGPTMASRRHVSTSRPSAKRRCGG